MTPSDKGFRADNLIPRNAVFRLKVHHKLVFCDGVFHVFFDKFSVIERFLKLFLIKKNVCQNIIFGRFSCHSGAVFHLPHLGGFILSRVDAECNMKFYVLETVDAFVDPVNECQKFVIRIIFCYDHENIAAQIHIILIGMA